MIITNKYTIAEFLYDIPYNKDYEEIGNYIIIK